MRRLATALVLLLAASAASAQSRVSINDYVQQRGFEFPSPPGRVDVLADGRIIVLSGTEVLRETAPGSRTFVSLGNLPDADFNEFGASFFKASPDGSRIAMGNNGGASFDHFQVGVFSFPGLAGTWFEANSAAGAWVNNRFVALTAGEFGTPSIVTLFDSESPNPAQPRNRTIIDNIGGASGGIAFDRDLNLYTGNGFATTGPSTTGEVKAFAAADWREAARTGTPIDFEAEGTVIVTALSASPLEFDRTGNLFVGGGDFFGGGDINFAAFVSAAAVRSALAGGGPADPGNPREVRKVDPDPAAGSAYRVIVNRARTEVYLQAGTHAFVFRAE